MKCSKVLGFILGYLLVYDTIIYPQRDCYFYTHLHDLFKPFLSTVKHLMIKMSERSFTQRFDDSMSSFSNEKRTKFDS